MINIVFVATIISICNVCNAKQDFDEEKQIYQFKDTSHPFNPFVLTNETRKPNHGNTSFNPKINAHGKSVQILGFGMYILPVKITMLQIMCEVTLFMGFDFDSIRCFLGPTSSKNTSRFERPR